MPEYRLLINGAEHRVEAEPSETLLSVLRDRLNFTGTKYGCGEGECGACTVLIEGEPIKSCQRRMAAVAGKKIVTIEGLAESGRLHPVQQAFLDQEAMQCAYCTPGMIMAAVGLLKRNPNYWKKDEAGRQLPYLDAVRLDIQPNRDIEVLRFRRGEIDLINSIEAEYYDRIGEASPALVRDAGPSLDTEQMWFNQVGTSPIPAYKIEWFRSQNFRRAVSEAINRADLARVAFSSHAVPAMGPVSAANKTWFDQKLKPIPFSPSNALQRLQKDGFRLDNRTLRDREGRPVEFSIITNAGNKYRERMAAMIQQDLGNIGIKVNVVALDFPSLIDRITQSFNYEACLLGLTNVPLDPNAQMNVWLSSGDNHQWNPGEKTPATPWEAELDRLMRKQASSNDFAVRKAAFDRVQEIVAEEVPFIYLVNKNALAAVSTGLEGEVPVVLRPQTYWNVERLKLKEEVAKARQ